MLRNKSDCCSNREGSDVFFDSSGEALTILYTFTTPLSSPDKTTEDSFPKVIDVNCRSSTDWTMIGSSLEYYFKCFYTE